MRGIRGCDPRQPEKPWCFVSPRQQARITSCNSSIVGNCGNVVKSRTYWQARWGLSLESRPSSHDRASGVGEDASPLDYDVRPDSWLRVEDADGGAESRSGG